MIIKTYFNFDKLNKLLGLLSELPKGFRPIYFSESEDVIDKSNDLVSDDLRFQKFRVNNPLGFFLYSSGCSIDIDISEKDECKAFFEVTRKRFHKDIPSVIRILSKINPSYAFACYWEEYLDRNEIIKRFDNYSLEAFVGRDFSKYLPGLYWGNLLSADLLRQHSLKIDALVNDAFLIEKIDDEYTWIQMYESPDDWKENSDRISHLCNVWDKIFSKKLLVEKAEMIKERASYDEFLDQWP